MFRITPVLLLSLILFSPTSFALASGDVIESCNVASTDPESGNSKDSHGTRVRLLRLDGEPKIEITLAEGVSLKAIPKKDGSNMFSLSYDAEKILPRKTRGTYGLNPVHSVLAFTQKKSRDDEREISGKFDHAYLPAAERKTPQLGTFAAAIGLSEKRPAIRISDTLEIRRVEGPNGKVTNLKLKMEPCQQ